MWMSRSLAIVSFALLGCSDGETSSATPPADGALLDASTEVVDLPDVTEAAIDGPADADADVHVDAHADADAGFDILGATSGECGALVGKITASGSFVVDVPIVFSAADKYERARLSPGGQKIFDAPNAGGSSKESEVMTFEILHHCDGASLLKTETEIVYGPPPDGGAATISDMIVSIGGQKIGVNPKRVFKPLPLTMTDAEVRDQLVKNFASIEASSARVSDADKWTRQILHVWVPSADYYEAVERVLPTIDASAKGNTIVLLTRATGGGFLFCDPDPAPGAECPPIK
jgi:hypothetical protein